MDLTKLIPWRKAPRESAGTEPGVPAFSATGGTVRTAKWLGYLPRNPTVSIALNFVATNWHEAPFTVETQQKGGVWSVVKGHASAGWPDGIDVRGGIWAASVTDFMCFGNVYWLAGNRGGAPVCVRLDPGRIEVFPGADGLVGGYRYLSRGGETLVLGPESVVHVRHGCDPVNQLVGVSPLAGMVREVMQDNMAGAYSLGLMNRFGAIGATFSSEPGAPILDAEARKAFKDAVQEAFTLEGAGSALVLPNGYKADYPARSPESLSLDGLRGWPQACILAALGLSPMAVGLPDPNKTYSNLIEARDSAWEQCLAPMKRTFAAAMTQAWSDGSWRYGIDLSAVRALADDSAKVADRASSLYASGIIDRAEARTLVGEEARPEDLGVYATDMPGLGAKALTDRMRAAQSARAHLADG